MDTAISDSAKFLGARSLEQLMGELPELKQSPLSSKDPVYAVDIALASSRISYNVYTPTRFRSSDSASGANELEQKSQTSDSFDTFHAGYVFGFHREHGIFMARKALLDSEGRPFTNSFNIHGRYIKLSDFRLYNRAVSLRDLNLDDSLENLNLEKIDPDKLNQRIPLLTVNIFDPITKTHEFYAVEIAAITHQDKFEPDALSSFSSVAHVFGYDKNNNLAVARDTVADKQFRLAPKNNGGSIYMRSIQSYRVIQTLRTPDS